jgi:hypothetical protein
MRCVRVGGADRQRLQPVSVSLRRGIVAFEVGGPRAKLKGQRVVLEKADRLIGIATGGTGVA